MRLRTNEEALSIINACAVEYKKNLSSNNLLFVTTGSNRALCFETLFMPHNFKHLTGVESNLSGLDFFDLAVRNRISPSEITLADDGTTDLKLDILPQLMNIHVTARMIGDYDHSRPLLIADKFAGAVTMAMGFVQTNGLYMPNTALKKDVRDITIHATRRRVTLIFVKHRHDIKYTFLSYIYAILPSFISIRAAVLLLR